LAAATPNFGSSHREAIASRLWADNENQKLEAAKDAILSRTVKSNRLMEALLYYRKTSQRDALLDLAAKVDHPLYVVQFLSKTETRRC
jgi:hypothetical protein